MMFACHKFYSKLTYELIVSNIATTHGTSFEGWLKSGGWDEVQIGKNKTSV